MITSIRCSEIVGSGGIFERYGQLVTGLDLASVDGSQDTALLFIAGATNGMEEIGRLRNALLSVARDIDAWLSNHASKN